MSASYKPGGMREMVSVALPMFVSFACDTVMIFTDRLLMSRLGPDLMNAALGGGICFYMLYTFMIGLVGYTTALAAQYLGKGEKHNSPKVAVQALLLALIAWPLLVLLREPLSRLFEVMGVPPGQLEPQQVYFKALALGGGIILLRHTLSSFFSGIGSTRVVMGASLLAMVVNVGASYVLIFGKFGFPAMGVTGAACGMLFASFCAFVWLALVFFSKKMREEFSVMKAFTFDAAIMKKLLRYGYPAGLEIFLAVSAFNFMVMTFHSLGPVSATAASIMLNWDLVTFLPLMGIEIGVTSLVGRYMGAGRPDIAHRSVMSGVGLGSCYSALMFVMFMFFSPQLATFFHPDEMSGVFEQSIPAAITMLRMICVYLAGEVIVVIFVGALRGAGDTHWAMRFSVALHWVLALSLFALLKFFHFPVHLGWGAVVILFLALSTLVLVRYREGKWKTLRIIEPGA